MLIKILIALGFLVVVFVVIVALRPAEFRVERSTRIAAPPAAVFAQVNDFHHWDAWSPWAKIDPAMTKAYSGASAGTGAIYSWQGNAQVGEGRMTIMESRPGEMVRIKLEFMKPFAATNTAEFLFMARDNQTEVTWTMTGVSNFMMKAVGLFVSMDKMVGGDFEKGLAQLKAVAESAAKR